MRPHSFLPTFFLALITISAVAHDAVIPKPKLLQNEFPIEKLAAVSGQPAGFKIIIPSDIDTLTFQTGGGTGDVDLYVRHDAHPTVDVYDDASTNIDNGEMVVIKNPAPGPWFVLLDSFGGYTGVRLLARYTLKPGAVAIPRLLPAPGTYASVARIQLKCATKGASIHYTTDDSEPTIDSPKFLSSLTFVKTTHLRVRAFGLDGVAKSPEVDGYYVIQPASAVTSIMSGIAIVHLGGHPGSTQLFKITVPPNETDLQIFTEGGTGDSQILVKRGSPPTSASYSRKVNGIGNKAVIGIKATPGDWYISLRGLTNFSGANLFAMVRPRRPDLIVWRNAIDPTVTTETFRSSDCEVEEGMIEAGIHTLLRFNTETRNIGATSIVMPKPEGNPNFEYAECHGHYHFKGFASYRLLNQAGQPVALGRKVSFCLEDVDRWDWFSPRFERFTCSNQGIQGGWADIYDSGLPGQWIDITGVPNGTYTLEITINPSHVLVEEDYSNNTETVPVVIEN